MTHTSRIADYRGEWFNMWLSDRECVLDTMIRNMVDDLNCGYDYYGGCIINQRIEIDNYKMETDAALESFKGMTEQQVDRWCFYDLIRRGAIG